VCTCRETAAEKDTGNFVVFDTIARTVRKSCGRELTKVTFRDRHSCGKLRSFDDARTLAPI
ncbi:hypothetical protein, partial [Serratia marcescens]|uniref:hypothetical protein n=1 Tax=Serratia marcescens TaxID=615 RepID=UPI001952B960